MNVQLKANPFSILFVFTLFSHPVLGSVPPRPKSLDFYFQTALKAQANQDLARSQRIFNWLTQKAPRKGLYWFNLGNTRFKMKDFAKALPAYQRVIQLKSPLAPVASLYIAKSQRLMGNPIAALNELETIRLLTLPKALAIDLQEETTESLKLTLSSGIALFDSSDYSQANRNFDFILKSQAASPELKEQARLMRAMSLLKSERIEEANLELAQISQSGKISGLKQTSRTLLSAVLKSDYFGQYPWWSFIDYSSGYNSNVDGDPSSSLTTASLFHQFLGGAGKRFFKRGEYIASISANTSFTQFFQDSSARNFQINLGLPLTIENPTHWKSLTPFLAYEISGPTPYLYRPGVSLGYGWKSSRRETALTYTMLTKIPANSTFIYAKGLIHELKATSSFIHPHELFIPSLIIGHEASDPLSVSGGSLPLARFYLAPGVTWKRLSQGKGSPWEFSGGVAYTYSFYDQNRRDGLISLDGTLGKWMSNALKCYAGLTFLENQSSLDSGAFIDKNFNAWIGSLGITWDIHQ